MKEPLTNIVVKLTGKDGNAFNIAGLVSGALKKAGRYDLSEQFFEEAFDGDYNHLLRTAMKYVKVR